jgi:bacteriorhodopsin
MKPFLWAVVACVAISVGAAYVLSLQDANKHPSRTADSVRLD